MVAYRVPQEVSDTRRYKIKKEAKKKCRGVSKEYLALQEFSIYITNVPPEVWPKEIVGTIYRIRWQIELVFKQWKQLFRIDVMKGSRPERIRCLIYGRLIMILMVNSLVSISALYAHVTLGREVSIVKLIQWLKRKERLSKALLINDFEALLDDLVKTIPHTLLKQKRVRKTSAELLQEQVPFLESFYKSKPS
jgi:IS4 transposase